MLAKEVNGKLHSRAHHFDLHRGLPMVLQRLRIAQLLPEIANMNKL